MNSIQTQLSHLPLFQDVEIDLLDRLPTPRRFSDGDTIFREDDPGDTFFFVLHGQVKISRHGIHLVTRQALEVVGEQAYIEKSPRSATASAIGAVELLEIPKLIVDELLSSPHFSRNLLSLLSVKLREATNERAYRYAQEQALFSEFRAHVAPEVLNELLAKGTDEYGEPRYTDAVILMSDIRGFSGASAEMTPKQIAHQLGAYLDDMVSIIHRHGGLVDKFVGDAVMAIWGGFQPSAQDIAVQAFECAKEMVQVAQGMSFGERPIAIGVGLNAGQVFVGNVGSNGKRQFTVLGTPVNAAARLESKTKELEAAVVIGEELFTRLPADIQPQLRQHPDTELKGVGTMTCYSVI